MPSPISLALVFRSTCPNGMRTSFSAKGSIAACNRSFTTSPTVHEKVSSSAKGARRTYKPPDDLNTRISTKRDIVLGADGQPYGTPKRPRTGLAGLGATPWMRVVIYGALTIGAVAETYAYWTFFFGRAEGDEADEDDAEGAA